MLSENIEATQPDINTDIICGNGGLPAKPKHSRKGNKFDRTEDWEERHDFIEGGEYMGNCHTGVYHSHGCGDILKMNTEHKVPTDNEKGLYRGCGHCKPGLNEFLKLDTFLSRDEPGDIELCEDPAVIRIFASVKCNCGSHDGIIKMYPHEGGVRLLGHHTKMWIYRECYRCGHQLSLDKAKARMKE